MTLPVRVHETFKPSFHMMDFFKKRPKPTDQDRSTARPPLDLHTPIRKVRYAVIDTELTGLNERRDSIVSLGALHLIDGRIELGTSFYRLLKPRTALRSDGILIHEITPSEVEEEPEIDQVLRDFLSFCDHYVLVGHCLSIDLNFINKEVKRLLGSHLANPALDTLMLYRWLRTRWPQEACFAAAPESVDLYGIARGFGISAVGAHNAVMDAFITAQLFQQFLSWLEKTGIKDLEGLLRVGDPIKGGDPFQIPMDLSNL
jgi:DNA polymerase-3 subunit epsilon